MQKTRGHAIGRNHEILDDFLGSVAFIRLQVLDFVSGKDRPGFQRLQLQGTVLVPQAFQLLRHPVLDLEILGQPRDSRDGLGNGALAFQPGRHAVVGELGLVLRTSAG